jgi:serine/threonine-protein kinase RsbW
MTTAGLAARLDFTLDDIEDLRMAVGEACALVLQDATPDGWLSAAFELREGVLAVRVAADSDAAEGPDTESFGWQVLSALTGDLEVDQSDAQRAIAFTVKSSVAV